MFTRCPPHALTYLDNALFSFYNQTQEGKVPVHEPIKWEKAVDFCTICQLSTIN